LPALAGTATENSIATIDTATIKRLFTICLRKCELTSAGA
jgi:hypothetical protein